MTAGSSPPPPARPPVPAALASVLVANRGEIVVRICRTLSQLGITSVAVYTPDDAGAVHVRCADSAVAVDSYLDADGLLAAAKRSGASAVHPGYGFLSEDPGFARAVVGAGLVWIGPPPDAIEAMGDKIRAKAMVAAAGVPVVPGAGRPGMTDPELVDAALAVGLPVLFKPAAGGGGKGMRKVMDPAALRAAIAAARREAAGAFADPTLLVERWISRPRHVEVQVFADAAGEVVHLGERECSLQRRHQKIVEESPSPFVGETTRAAMVQSAIDAARACGYVGAGTVEFIVSGDDPDEYFFMEMNTRLQVEHPVTEMVTGIDLVEWQLRVAAGEPLPRRQPEIPRSGHAVEARLYAEDPQRGFLPSNGTVALLVEPGGPSLPGIRVDSALAPGAPVGTRYDPMLAKVVAWAPTREEALHRLRHALRSTTILGVTTNLGYLVRLLGHPDVVAGRLDTELVDRTLESLSAPDPDAPTSATLAAAARLASDLEPRRPAVDPWDVPDGWRVGGRAEWVLPLRRDGKPVAVGVRGRITGGGDAAVRIDDGPPVAVTARVGDGTSVGDPASGCDLGEVLLTVDAATTRWRTAFSGDELWVGREGWTWRFRRDDVTRQGLGIASAEHGPVRSPMPGVVIAVHVSEGDRVSSGDPLVSVEAMKMEHAVVAPGDGMVTTLWVRQGQAVALDEPLAEVFPHDEVAAIEDGGA
jgi:acetyl-CoA/propionyl-CoA carboxylase, biotin carboxylase, biotin carboxyl carrier protein